MRRGFFFRPRLYLPCNRIFQRLPDMTDQADGPRGQNLEVSVTKAENRLTGPTGRSLRRRDRVDLFPRLIRVELCYASSEGRRAPPKILLEDGSLMIDDECHQS